MVSDNCLTCIISGLEGRYTIEVNSHAVVICFRTQFLLDIFVYSVDNFRVRHRNFTDRDVRTILFMSFQKLFLTPGQRIKSIFGSHTIHSKILPTARRGELYRPTLPQTQGYDVERTSLVENGTW
jgi:hypothetical protein